jgi:hypothetical protein
MPLWHFMQCLPHLERKRPGLFLKCKEILSAGVDLPLSRIFYLFIFMSFCMKYFEKNIRFQEFGVHGMCATVHACGDFAGMR